MGQEMPHAVLWVLGDAFSARNGRDNVQGRVGGEGYTSESDTGTFAVAQTEGRGGRRKAVEESTVMGRVGGGGGGTHLKRYQAQTGAQWRRRLIKQHVKSRCGHLHGGHPNCGAACTDRAVAVAAHSSGSCGAALTTTHQSCHRVKVIDIWTAWAVQLAQDELTCVRVVDAQVGWLLLCMFAQGEHTSSCSVDCRSSASDKDIPNIALSTPKACSMVSDSLPVPSSGLELRTFRRGAFCGGQQ